jgi:hypothetical protein
VLFCLAINGNTNFHVEQISFVVGFCSLIYFFSAELLLFINNSDININDFRQPDLMKIITKTSIFVKKNNEAFGCIAINKQEHDSGDDIK